jgi:hypothetical protein
LGKIAVLGGYVENQNIYLGYVAKYQKPWLGDVQVDIRDVGYHPSWYPAL